MPKSLRCLIIALIDIPNECKIILGYLTYHSESLFNQALYSIKTKSFQSRSAQIVLDELVRV
jgi:putative transposase